VVGGAWAARVLWILFVLLGAGHGWLLELVCGS
jgi:hypothetical protein